MVRRNEYRFRLLLVAGLAGMLTSTPGTAAIYTVGPSGSFGTLQAAVDAAAATADDDQLRLEAVVLFGAASINVDNATGSLIVSGGWNSSFTELIASGNAFNSTFLNASGSDTTLRVSVSSGILELSGFRVSFGSGASGTGGNIEAKVNGGELRLFDMHFRNGSAVHVGAGGQFTAYESGTIRGTLCSFANNNLTPTAATRAGAGARLNAADSGLIVFSETDIFANEAGAGAPVSGVGLDVDARGDSRVILSDVLIVSNSTAASSGSAFNVTARGNALVNGERLTLSGNSGAVGATAIRQVQVATFDSAQVYLTDSLISDSAMTGIGAMATAGNGIHFNNLTVTRNTGAGVAFFAQPGASITLHNSIVHGNGSSEPATTASGNNVGANLGLPAPTFVTTGNYRLAPGSRGIDEGTAAVPGGLGLLDLDRQERISGASVDIGAYEQVSDTQFANGFEGSAP